MKLKDKVAVVTGGSKGIGKGISLSFAGEGAKIVIADVLIKEGRETVKEIEDMGNEAIFIETDVSDIKQVKKLATKTIEKYNTVDILANIAGISRAGNVIDVSMKDWNDIIAVNLTGVFICCKVFGKIMKEQESGKIINMASVAGRSAEKGNVPYCVTKAGVISITQGLALELSKHNVNVNAICPGVIYTDLIRQIFIERAPVYNMSSDELKSKFESGIPKGRVGTPADVGKIAVFLASEDSDYVIGQTVVVDGGFELTRQGL